MLSFLKFRVGKSRKNAPSDALPAVNVQLRDSQRHPFGLLRDFTPLGGCDVRLFRAVREAVPVVDAAVYKLIRLTGGLSVLCDDPRAQYDLREFLRSVPVGRGQFGINAFIDSYLDSLLTCGRAVGEIVPAAEGLDIAALLCGNVEDVLIKEGRHPLDFLICASDGLGGGSVLPRQDLLLFTPLNPESANPYGVSFLRGLPFLADILMKIYHSIGVNWERCGNVRFAVTCKNADGSAAQKGRVLADEWARAMRDGRDGRVSDFVAVGDVDIKVIGADAPIPDSSAPVRQIMEQIIAKTGIPPFMLGLSWSATERMSTQQADLLTTEITALRRALTPAVERVCRLWLRMHGFSCNFQVLWDDINLQDQVEEAKAELYRQQARKLMLENDALDSPDQKPLPDINADSSGRESLPDINAGSSGRDSLPDTGTGTSGRDSLPDTGTGTSGRDSLPDTGTGASGRDSLPDIRAGSSDRKSLPDTGAGTSGRDSLPDTGAGASGRESLPDYNSDSFGRD